MTKPLEKIDLDALRRADSISFHYRADNRGSHFPESKDYICATKRPQPDKAFETERQHFIACEHEEHVYRAESDLGGNYEVELESGFDMIHSAEFDHDWRTIAGLLRRGDILRLVWCAGGASNGYIKDAGLRGDTLRLEVQRGDKRRAMSFLVATSVCARNSAAMCQTRRKKESQP